MSMPTELEDDDPSDGIDMVGPSRLGYYTPIRDYPPMADRKATALLAADGLMISVLLLFRKPLEAMLRGSGLGMTYLLLTLMASFAALFLIGGYCAYRVLTRPIPPMPTSLAFFPEIAKRTLDQYRDQVHSLSQRASIRAILDYNYSLAILSRWKFALVGRATSCVRAQFFLWIVLLAVVAVVGRPAPPKVPAPAGQNRAGGVGGHVRISTKGV